MKQINKKVIALVLSFIMAFGPVTGVFAGVFIKILEVIHTVSSGEYVGKGSYLTPDDMLAGRGYGDELTVRAIVYADNQDGLTVSGLVYDLDLAEGWLSLLEGDELVDKASATQLQLVYSDAHGLGVSDSVYWTETTFTFGRVPNFEAAEAIYSIGGYDKEAFEMRSGAFTRLHNQIVFAEEWISNLQDKDNAKKAALDETLQTAKDLLPQEGVEITASAQDILDAADDLQAALYDYYQEFVAKFADEYPKIDTVTHNKANVFVKADKKHTVYFGLVSKGAEAPTASELMEENPQSGKFFLIGSQGPLEANIEYPLGVDLPQPDTSYDLYMVAVENETGCEVQGTVSKLEIKSQPTPTTDTQTPGTQTPGTSTPGTQTPGTQTPSAPALTEAINKLLEKGNNNAAQAVAAALNKQAEVKNVKVEKTADGKNVAKVEVKDLENALADLLKAFADVEKQLKEKGNDKAAQAVKASLAIKISVTNVSKDETVIVPVAAEFMKQLQEKGIGIQVETQDTVVTLPAKAISADLLKDAKEVRMTKEPLKADAAKAVTDQATGKNAGLTPVGKVYNFTVSIVDNAGVEKNVEKFNAKAKVELKVDAADLSAIKDKRKAGVYYVAADGTVEFKGGQFSETGITFETEHFSNYVIMQSNKTFGDIQGNWAKDYIEVLAARQIALGDGVNFSPAGKVTRGEFATFVGRAFELKAAAKGEFSDVSADKYYAGYVAAMKQAGIVSGYADGTFKPDAEITREQMMTMIMAAYAYTTGESLKAVQGAGSASFADLDTASSYAVESIKAAKALGIAGGIGANKFNPKGKANRAEMSKMIIELLQKSGKM